MLKVNEKVNRVGKQDGDGGWRQMGDEWETGDDEDGCDDDDGVECGPLSPAEHTIDNLTFLNSPQIPAETHAPRRTRARSLLRSSVAARCPGGL